MVTVVINEQALVHCQSSELVYQVFQGWLLAFIEADRRRLTWCERSPLLRASDVSLTRARRRQTCCVDFESTADELYALYPTVFTQARDAFVAVARKEGDRETAEALKRLRRPSLGAWLANRIVRERKDDVDHLLTVAAALRKAQDRLDGEAMRRLSRQGRDAVDALVRDASVVAEEDDQGVPGVAIEDLEATLDAALGDPTSAETLRTGRLTTALHYSGLGLTGTLETAPSRGSRANTASRSAQAATDLEWKRARDDLERVRAQLRDAETAVAAAQTTLAERKDVAQRAARRVREAEKTLRDAEKRTQAKGYRKT